ncbi:MAG: ABC transporter ATP-binding protein [Burkholderia sp.]
MSSAAIDAAPLKAAENGNDSGLQARGLSLRYPGGAAIAEQLDVTIAPHRVTAIVGPNGCGKSTLLKALSRLLRPARGSVLLDGRDVRDYASKPFARRVGFLPQSSQAPDGVTVAELVGRGRYPHQSAFGWQSAADRAAIADAMTATDVAELADRPVSELSGGQRQRVWIAMSLAQQTDILLLDEPTTFLDLAHRIEVLELCHQLNVRHGTTIVAVLHDLNEACRYADDMIVMRGGRIVARGDPCEIVTPAVIRAAFGLDTQVIADPVTGTPLVLPLLAGKRRSASSTSNASNASNGG